MFELLDLARTDESGGIGTFALGLQQSYRLEPVGFDELSQFIARIRSGSATDGDGDEIGAGSRLRERLINLEDGQESDSGVRVTGRAGTTVEIACL